MKQTPKKKSTARAPRAAKATAATRAPATPTAPATPKGPTDAPPASTEAVMVATQAAAADAKAAATPKKGEDSAAAQKQAGKARIALDQFFPPALKEEWKRQMDVEQQENIRSAREAYTRRGLVLYLGAGVSCSVGLPTWWEMIRSLTVKMMSERVDKETGTLSNRTDEERAQAKLSIEEEVSKGTGADQSILMMARSIKDYFGPRLAYELSQTLYRPLAKGIPHLLVKVLSLFQKRQEDPGSLEEYPTIQKSALFKAIVQLARAQRDVRGVTAIVNFNYDDLIEEWMRENGIRCDSLLSGQEAGRDASLPCYHVHGVLPFRKVRDMKEPDAPAMRPLIGNFVFSEDEYHTEYSDPYRWSNMTMINQLGRYSGLFIGLSLLDPNLRRLIDVTHRQYPDIKNYAILTRKAPPQGANGKEPFLRDLFEKVETESFATIGVQVIWTDSYDEVPQRILDICNIDEKTLRT
jgi:hypothetical protein